jgi:hypothetical protein
MFWKPIMITGPAGAFKVTDPEAGSGDLNLRFDRAPSAEWTRIFNELWSGDTAQMKLEGDKVSLSGVTRDGFLDACVPALEACLQETNDKQAELVAKKMGMPFKKEEPTDASRAQFRSAIEKIDWGA